MSDYIKSTDFTAKDSLPSGDPDKIVSGQLFQDEFDAIRDSLLTKVNVEDIPDPVLPDIPNRIIKSREFDNFSTFAFSGHPEDTFLLYSDNFSIDFDTNKAGSSALVTSQFSVRTKNASGNVGIEIRGRFRLTNKDTNVSYLYPPEGESPIFWQCAPNKFSPSNTHRYQASDNVVWRSSLGGSPVDLVGASGSGYKIELLLNPLRAAGSPEVDAILLDGNVMMIVEELIT